MMSSMFSWMVARRGEGANAEGAMKARHRLPRPSVLTSLRGCRPDWREGVHRGVAEDAEGFDEAFVGRDLQREVVRHQALPWRVAANDRPLCEL